MDAARCVRELLIAVSLAIVGGTVLDVIFRGLPRLPAWPEHTEFTAANLVRPAHPPLVTLGGNGANAAYVAASCGAPVTLHTAIADDAFGTLARGWLREARCAVRSIAAAATAVNVTAADPRHRRATMFYAGTPVPMPRLAAEKRRPRAVLVSGWPHPPLVDIAREFAALRGHGALTAFDPGPLLGKPWSLRSLRPVLAELDLLLANEHELGALARRTLRAEAVRRFRRAFSGHIVLKCGPEGARWFAPGEMEETHFRAPRVRPLNTVGAGDSFNGALLAALVRGNELPTAITQAVHLAAQVVASPEGVRCARQA